MPKIQFRKDKIYDGKKITCQYSPNEQSYEFIQVTSDDNSHINFAVNINSDHNLYLKDYFYTEAELRKKKIDKINNPFYKFLNLFK